MSGVSQTYSQLDYPSNLKKIKKFGTVFRDKTKRINPNEQTRWYYFTRTKRHSNYSEIDAR